MEKKDGFLSTIKGFITGIATLIPGISPASIVLSLNSYDDIVESLNKKKDKRLKLVTIPFIIGIVIGLLSGSHLVDFFYNKYRVQTIMLFTGLVIGGIRVLYSSKKIEISKNNIFIFIIMFILMLGSYFLFRNVEFFEHGNRIINIIVLGVISGISLLIPPISLASIHTVGKYNYLVDAINNLTSFSNIMIVIIFIIVTLIVFVIISKLIYQLFKRNKNRTYISLFSLMFTSVIISIFHIKSITVAFVPIFTSILAFLWGYILAKNIEKE